VDAEEGGDDGDEEAGGDAGGDAGASEGAAADAVVGRQGCQNSNFGVVVFCYGEEGCGSAGEELGGAVLEGRGGEVAGIGVDEEVHLPSPKSFR
jgi:hypothetical protein